MYNLPEPPFTIDGVKSWIHCLDMYVNPLDTAPELPPKQYHYHNYIEFLYAIDVDAYVWINGQKYHFCTGDLIIINSEELHCVHCAKRSHYICVEFSPSVLYSDERSLFEFKYAVPFLLDGSHQKIFSKEVFENFDIYSAVTEIMNEWNQKRSAYELMIRSNILRIFSAIFRYWDNESAPRRQTVLTDSIKKALIYVSQNLESVTEQDAANAAGLSYNHFSSIFNKTVGKSFNEYVTLMRINEAEKLLLSTDKSVTEIAMCCGFSSSSHFVSRFGQYKQITPGQFRKKLRKSE